MLRLVIPLLQDYRKEFLKKRFIQNVKVVLLNLTSGKKKEAAN